MDRLYLQYQIQKTKSFIDAKICINQYIDIWKLPVKIYDTLHSIYDIYL